MATMRFFRRLPIGRKLTITTMAISSVGLLIAGSTIAIYEQIWLRHQVEHDFAVLADIFDDNVAPALAFNAPTALRQTLATLKANQRIVAAGVYDRQGNLVVRFDGPAAPAEFNFPAARPTGQSTHGDRLDTFKNVVLGDETIGTVYIGSDLGELRERAWLYSGIIGGMMVVISGVALILTERFQRIISGPIVDLARTMTTVRVEKNYAVRAVKRNDDELGRLFDGFNEMLEQIQARDVAVQRAHDQLEARVRERTSELKQAQAEVAHEKDRLQLIFESVPIGICLDYIRAGGDRSRLINSAHLTICGLTREQVTPGAFQRVTHPDDVARQQKLRDQLDAGLIDQFSLEQRYVKMDGRFVWVVFTVQRRRTPDGGWQDLSTVVDITDLKRAQEAAAREHARFKFIFESVPMGISLVTIDDSRTHLVNPAHVRITGVSAEDSSAPGAFMRASHPEDYRIQMERAEPFIRGEVDHYAVEKRYLHPDGRVVWSALTSRKFADTVAGTVQVVTTLVDITEHKKAETKLAETYKQLLETSRQAGMAEVATGVLHNVGNVLNSVNVSATLVTDRVRGSKTANLTKLGALLREHSDDLASFLTIDPKGQRIPGYLLTLADQIEAERQIVTEELGHLRKNVEHIKDIVAMQQSYAKVSGVLETVAVSELVEDALRINASALVRHGLEIVREFGSDQPVTVERHKVLQILVNLIRNAKHACDDSGRVDKQLTVRIARDDTRVRVSIIDNGIGIPAENLTRIFAHGFTTKKDGHGFGLHSGALAARELGGSLTARSDGPGHGAAFTLELPFKNDSGA